jgi:hypothetical protein
MKMTPFLILKIIKKLLKPFASVGAKIAVWVILFFNFFLFNSKKNHISVLLANLCFGKSLAYRTNLERLRFHITNPDSMPENMFVWSGEWDRDIILTEDHEKFVMMKELFIENKDYRDTQFYSFAKEQILKDEPLQRGNILLDSDENITLYFEKYKKLFSEIKSRGFDPDLAPEIGIVIGRDGQFLYFRQGHHSHAIGKMMGVKSATVRIRAVHGIWLSDQIKNCSRLHLLKCVRSGFKNLFD